MGHRGRESLWKMVGMYSLVWEAFAEFTYIAFQDLCFVVFQYWFSSIDRDFIVSDGTIVSRNCFGQVVCPLVTFQTRVSFVLDTSERKKEFESNNATGK